MIDNKKIEEAAKQHLEESYISSYFQACYKDAFMEGAKWAINELFKNLLHPAEDIPEQERPVLVVYKHGGYSIEYWKAYNISGQVNYWTLDITQWLYVDELFPKDGGNHD